MINFCALGRLLRHQRRLAAVLSTIRLSVISLTQQPQGSPLMKGYVLCSVTFDLILGFFLAGVMYVPFPVYVFHMQSDDFSAHAPGL